MSRALCDPPIGHRGSSDVPRSRDGFTGLAVADVVNALDHHDTAKCRVDHEPATHRC